MMKILAEKKLKAIDPMKTLTSKGERDSPRNKIALTSPIPNIRLEISDIAKKNDVIKNTCTRYMSIPVVDSARSPRISEITSAIKIAGYINKLGRRFSLKSNRDIKNEKIKKFRRLKTSRASIRLLLES